MHIEQVVGTTTLHILHSVHTGTTFHILHSVQGQLSIFCTVYRNNSPYSAECTGTTFHILQCTGQLYIFCTVYRNNYPYSAQCTGTTLNIFCTMYRNNFPYSAQCTGTTSHILHSVQEQLPIFCTVYRNNNCPCFGFGKINLEKILVCFRRQFFFHFFEQTIPS
jgi:hypothetical protein